MHLCADAKAELERLREKYGGEIAPRMVLFEAKNKGSPLHYLFNWSDTDAANKYRLLQAGAILRSYVVVRSETKEPVRGFVSLVKDRNSAAKEMGNGVRRHIDDIMNDDELRANLIETALMELRSFRRKYERIKELAELWNVLDRIEVKHAPTSKSQEVRASA